MFFGMPSCLASSVKGIRAGDLLDDVIEPHAFTHLKMVGDAIGQRVGAGQVGPLTHLHVRRGASAGTPGSWSADRAARQPGSVRAGRPLPVTRLPQVYHESRVVELVLTRLHER